MVILKYIEIQIKSPVEEIYFIHVSINFYI